MSADLLAVVESAVRERGGDPSRNESRFRCPQAEQHTNGDVHASGRWNRAKQAWFCDVCDLGGGYVDLAARLGVVESEAKLKRRIVATYPYRDEHGTLLFEVLRYDPKGFSQRRPDDAGGFTYRLGDTRRVLYRLPELVVADPSRTVYVVEGEQDVDALWACGLVATTNPGGAEKWRDEYAEALRGRRVIVLPDNDPPGRQHAEAVVRSLRGVALSVRTLSLPGLTPKGDVSDWLAAGGTAEALEALVTARNDSSAPYGENPAGASKEDRAPAPLPFRTPRELGGEAGIETEWVIEPYVAAGAITELAGKIKAAGKTTFVLAGVRAVLEGQPFLGHRTARGPVVYLTEQPWVSFRQALRRAELLDRDDLHLLRFHDVFGIAWVDVVRGAIAQAVRVGAKLLVVDTLSHFASLRGDAENTAGEALEALRPLQALAARHGIGVVIVRHERKSGGDIGDATRGSTAFGGAVDVLLLLRRLPNAPRKTMRTLLAISRFDETPEELVIELADGGHYVALGSGDDLAARENERLVFEALPGDPLAAIRAAAPPKDPDADCLLTRINRSRVDGAQLKRTVLDETLKRLCDQKRADRIGDGKKNDPHRYYRVETAAPEEEFAL